MRFKDGAGRIAEALRDLAHQERFREAVLWQSWAALHRGIDWLLRQPANRNDREVRRNERLVANYLRRSCLEKNDTIGFRVTEMLPTIEETWLTDARGNTHTSELRLVALDPVPWRPPGRPQ